MMMMMMMVRLEVLYDEVWRTENGGECGGK